METLFICFTSLRWRVRTPCRDGQGFFAWKITHLLEVDHYYHFLADLKLCGWRNALKPKVGCGRMLHHCLKVAVSGPSDISTRITTPVDCRGQTCGQTQIKISDFWFRSSFGSTLAQRAFWGPTLKINAGCRRPRRPFACPKLSLVLLVCWLFRI